MTKIAHSVDKIWRWPITVLFVAGALIAGYALIRSQTRVNDFESCKKAGGPILESFPEQCLANGKTYINTEHQGAIVD